MLMKTMPNNAIWMGLANHLAGFITTGKDDIFQVYSGEVDASPAAFLRIWGKRRLSIFTLDGMVDIDDVFVKSTIALTSNTAFCTNHEKGVRRIELAHPRACELILEWMIYVGLTSKDVVWRDPD